ncbi:quinone oxidoreductase family protein [Sphingobacterium sp. Mn56C]|uniref:quinone oxidoreductase family protein n=1 Tax=Sphingobacterium sp. Mn56C TaxID=3395261 RepID=UPI003BD475F5
MDAIVLHNFGGVENFSLKTVEEPVLDDFSVLVQIKATAFNPIDYQMRMGSTESKLLHSPILGREFAGQVIAVGAAVKQFEVGDAVAAYVGSLASNGTYAQRIAVPEALLAKIPEQLSFEEAAALPMVGLTALQCVSRLQLPTDAAVFITGGSGAVGSMVIRLLKAAAVDRIYTTAANEARIADLQSLGLSPACIINYNTEPVRETLLQRHGVFQYVIDLVGGALSETCAEVLDVFGTYVDVTSFTTDKARALLFDKAASCMHIANYAMALHKGVSGFASYGDGLRSLFAAIENKAISPLQVKCIGGLTVQTVQQAHLLMENNDARGKKLVMSVA